jgi:hypothetical protein
VPGDTFTGSARDILDTAVTDMRAAIGGLDADALNWKPVDGANSIAVLAVHSMHSTRSWISIAAGAGLPERDRDSEFVAEAADAASLTAFVDGMADDCRALLKGAAVGDWSAMRVTHPRNRPDAEPQAPASWALLHALEHLREHVGQMQLTRQLVNGRKSS